MQHSFFCIYPLPDAMGHSPRNGKRKPISTLVSLSLSDLIQRICGRSLMIDNASLFYSLLHLTSLQHNYLTPTVPHRELVGFFLILTSISLPLQIKADLIIWQIANMQSQRQSRDNSLFDPDYQASMTKRDQNLKSKV